MALIKMNLRSHELKMQTSVSIILPTGGYGENYNKILQDDMKYQTLLLLHGACGDNEDYIHYSNIVRYAEENRLAVIMPSGYNSFYTDDPNGLFGGMKYFTYISQELPKVCSSLFPLSQKREDNFVGGLSMGAVGAFKLGTLYPERYSCVLCMSGGGRGPQNPEKGIEHTLLPGFAKSSQDIKDDPWNYIREQVQAGKQMPKFFLTCGTKDNVIYKDYLDTIELLKELNIDFFSKAVPNYAHEWDFWDLSLKRALYEWLPLKRNILYEH